MVFRQGQVIEEFATKDGRKVILRIVRYSDVKQMLSLINSVIEEDTFIPMRRKRTLKEENDYVKGILKDMKHGERITIVSEIDRKIVGNCNIRQLTERSPHIGEFGIIVLKRYRNLGIGKRLMKSSIIIAKRMKFKYLFLGVFANNHIALRLYEKYGFRKVARLPKFLLRKSRYVDEILMMKRV